MPSGPGLQRSYGPPFACAFSPPLPCPAGLCTPRALSLPSPALLGSAPREHFPSPAPLLVLGLMSQGSTGFIKATRAHCLPKLFLPSGHWALHFSPAPGRRQALSASVPAAWQTPGSRQPNVPPPPGSSFPPRRPLSPHAQLPPPSEAQTYLLPRAVVSCMGTIHLLQNADIPVPAWRPLLLAGSCSSFDARPELALWLSVQIVSIVTVTTTCL